MLHAHEVTGSSPVGPIPINHLQRCFLSVCPFFALGATVPRVHDRMCLPPWSNDLNLSPTQSVVITLAEGSPRFSKRRTPTTSPRTQKRANLASNDSTSLATPRVRCNEPRAAT